MLFSTRELLTTQRLDLLFIFDSGEMCRSEPTAQTWREPLLRIVVSVYISPHQQRKEKCNK